MHVTKFIAKHIILVFIFLKDFYVFIFREGRGGREGEKHQCVAASCAPTTGDLPATQACALDWESNQRPFGPQADAQSTEPHQPGQAL